MRLFYRLILTIAFLAVLTAIIALARGYRPDFQKQNLTSTGIIAISAYPKASKVYIDGLLKGVTDINVTLPPGEYRVEVKKDGFTNWSKTVKLKGELVLTLDVLLYPLNPSLSPLTNLGVVNAVPMPQADKIILFSENGDVEKDGVYLFDSTKNPLSFFPPLKLLVLKKALTDLLGSVDFKQTIVDFSPDNKEAIFSFNNTSNVVKTASYLISLENENTNLFDISASKETLIEAWANQKNEVNQKILEAYPKDVAKVASDSFHVIDFSPDESKVLYIAANNVLLPPAREFPLIAVNQTPEERNLKVGNIYVYDKKEDRNYYIQISNDQIPRTKQITNYNFQIKNNLGTWNLELGTFISWYSDSKHLVINEGKKISLIDYDNLNKQTIYSGPFAELFYKVTSDGKIIVLTNLNPEANKLPDLYAVGIK